jgi:hypothetical protein
MSARASITSWVIGGLNHAPACVTAPPYGTMPS